MTLKDRFQYIPEEEIVTHEEIVVSKPENNFEEIFENILVELSQKISSIPVWFEYSDKEQQDLISGYISAKLKELNMTLNNEEKDALVLKIFNSVFGFGILDNLISKDDILSIVISSDGKIELKKSNEIQVANISLDGSQINKITTSLLQTLPENQRQGLVNLKFKGLQITLILPPVSSGKIIIKKLLKENIDFEYMIEKNLISNELSEILKSYMSLRKNILITGQINSGKSALLSCFLNLEKNSNSILFQTMPLFDKIGNIETYNIANLKDNEIEKLISTLLISDPEYIFADINLVKLSDIFSTFAENRDGFISTIRANSTVDAISRLALSKVNFERCTEKSAKSSIAGMFDYIIHVENNKIKSISSLSLNKSGSLVIEDIQLPVEKVEKIENTVVETKIESKVKKTDNSGFKTFSSRFN